MYVNVKMTVGSRILSSSFLIPTLLRQGKRDLSIFGSRNSPLKTIRSPARAFTAAEENKQIRVGIIGFGRIGHFHADTVASHSPFGRLVWISDIVQKDTVKNLDCDFIHTDQLEAALSATQGHKHFADAVIVCPSTQFLAQYTELSLKHDKSVFCEKPLTSDLHRLEELFDLAENRKRILQIGFQRVYDKDISKLIEEVRSYNAKGNPIWSISMRTYDSPTAPADYLRQDLPTVSLVIGIGCRSCGPVFLDAMCHDFHVAASLLPVDDSIDAVVTQEASFDDKSLGARSASAIFTTRKGTMIASEFHRVSQMGYDNSIDVTFPDKIFRLHSRPRFSVSTADGSGEFSNFDFDDSFITKYGAAYHSEVASFIEDVRQHSSGGEHRTVCLNAMRMVKMAIDSATRK